jgi:hypothetical protein
VPPYHQQVRLEREQAFDVDFLVVADTRNRARGWRVVAVADGADDMFGAAGGKQQFGDMRRERYHAPRRLLQHHGGPGIVAHADRGTRLQCACASDQEQTRPHCFFLRHVPRGQRRQRPFTKHVQPFSGSGSPAATQTARSQRAATA